MNSQGTQNHLSFLCSKKISCGHPLTLLQKLDPQSLKLLRTIIDIRHFDFIPHSLFPLDTRHQRDSVDGRGSHQSPSKPRPRYYSSATMKSSSSLSMLMSMSSSSWLEIPPDCDFGLHNVPFGVCSFPSQSSPPPMTTAMATATTTTTERRQW